MRLNSSLVALRLLLLSSCASATFFRGHGLQLGPVYEEEEGAEFSLAAVNDNDNPNTNGWGTFDQLLDHSNPSLGTFRQRYWYGTQYWKGPGSPIIFYNPGEQSGDGFNISFPTSKRLPGLFAEQLGGAVVIMEHRYWGESSPFQELTSENLQYLTLENSIKDNVYFANNFKPPFDGSGGSAPDKAPWIFSGGSYPGALAGWLASVEPGTFWAYHGTSGVVQAVGDFWQYFRPVMEATPRNCSKDLGKVINYIDHVLLHGSKTEKKKLKAKFLLSGLEDADFASALENGPWSWQSTQFYSEKVQGYNSYHQFCDYIENVWPNSTKSVPGPEGVGRVRALEGYAKWAREVLVPGYCDSGPYDDWKGEYNIACFASLNSSNVMYMDLSPGNYANRQWTWLLCNEPLMFWQDGAPKNRPTIVSRLANRHYWEKQCSLFFPDGYGIQKGKTVEQINAYTGGWSVTNTTRLMYANGQFDPWRDATVSSVDRPDGPLRSTAELPVRVIPGGVHCSDYYKPNWDANENAKRIAYEQVENMKTWVAEFKSAKN
ncbi:serine-type peptidase-like protein [Dactylonectria macrodidyma]|uniref:Serine-type peptidase-like protein n=1 Tax=Dactylonectria macrodidyma TaxID=307937 RepID=A0A9P9CZM3_9HYPO|nr:serine-type peptidase-like protein [Dactylonectria macrodidyma]